MEALKAQAVAARSYALARGGTICATETCQVFKPEARVAIGKSSHEPVARWFMLMVNRFLLVCFYFWRISRILFANGYSTPGFWDTANGRSGWTGQLMKRLLAPLGFIKLGIKLDLEIIVAEAILG
jgi:hypothetical protein